MAAQTTIGSSPPASLQRITPGQVVSKQIGDLRGKLLDLTGRNKLLNFKPRTKRKEALVLRQGIVEIIGEDPQFVFQRLVGEGKSMSFKPDQRKGHDDTITDWELQEDFDAEEYQGQKTDAYLNTTHSALDLDKRLYRTYLDARAIFEEQGYRILYLAIGFLEYKDKEQLAVDTQAEKWLAPLILVPLEMSRAGVGKPFKITYTGDEIYPNLSLQARLAKDFDIGLPELDYQADDFTVEGYLAQVEAAIKGKPEWSVKRDMYVGFFSFAKFVMWKDLDPTSWPAEQEPTTHPILAAAIDSSVNLTEPFDALPIVEERELDQRLRAHDIYHILDADPSQIAVIEEIKGGRCLVVQGPPGTGKSQTIANAIAELLAAGKKVLFVSEKMAALEVVKSRLDAAGLGVFCLELHSHKASKREVLAQLKQAMEYRPPDDPQMEQQLAQLETTKRQLNEYAAILRAPVGVSGRSPYKLYGMSERAESKLTALGFADRSPKIPELEGADAVQIDAALLALDRFASAARPVFPAQDHAWHGTMPPGFKDDQDDLLELIRALRSTLEQLQTTTISLERDWGIAAPQRVADLPGAIEAARFLQGKPELEVRLLTNSSWNELPPQAATLLTQVEDYRSLKDKSLTLFREKALDAAIEPIQASLAKQTDSFFGRLFSGDYKSARRTAQSWYAGSLRRTPRELLADVELLRDTAAARAALRSREAEARELFGGAWKGPDTDSRALRALGDWLVGFRRKLLAGTLSDTVVTALPQRPQGELSRAAAELEDLRSKLDQQLFDLRQALSVSGDVELSGEAGLSALAERLSGMERSAALMGDWAAYLHARTELTKTIAAPLADYAEVSRVVPDSYRAVFEKSLSSALLRRAFKEHPVLMNFTARAHSELIAEFARLDREILQLNRRRLARRLHVASLAEQQSNEKQRKLVKHETGKMKRHIPIRELLGKSGGFVMALKPCMMMSPLSVAQYLTPGQFLFDVVIFDEASQVRPEDAIGAIVRGRQLVVVGDSKQMPPTSFFDRVEREEAASFDEEELEDEPPVKAGEHESILLMYASAGIPERTLNWHYRSKHESLISLANSHYYENRLMVFPSNPVSMAQLGLEFVSTWPAPYEGKGTNTGEAEMVVQAIYEHYQQTPHLSLGVGTFGIAQQRAIDLKLNKLVQDTKDYNFEAWWHSGPTDTHGLSRHEHGFIKNLETIQGDERDVILISVGYGKAADGKLAQRFGPLNSSGGERRLNVMITRARFRCRVFCNFKAGDLRIDEQSAAGLKGLHDFLHYAETGKLVRHTGTSMEGDSEFEESVRDFLVSLNYEVERQYGDGTYRIDLVVRDPKDNSKLLCGVECDGATYHSSYVARERDRLREEVLRQRGWEIVRVWSTDWFRHPESARKTLNGQLQHLQTLSIARQHG